MTTLNIESQVPFEALVKSLPQLSLEELEELSQIVLSLKAKQKAPYLSNEEANLLDLIYELAVPSQIHERLRTLDEKEQLSAEEEMEYQQLIDEIEQLNAKRLGYLAKLAELRQTTLAQIMSTLEIQPISYD